MNDTTQGSLARARSALADAFYGVLEAKGTDFAAFEREAISMGHDAMAAALGDALTRRDKAICEGGVCGLRSKGLRQRTLATEVGDVSFSWHRMTDVHGNSAYPLADELDLPWGARVSPGAREFLVEAGANVSYSKACGLLARHGSRVSPTSCMMALREAGALCEAADERAAESLLEQGVLPEAEVEAKSLRVESDGVWVRLQGVREGEPKKAEIKAACAYGSKVKKGKKTLRTNTVSHGCVATPKEFWAQSLAAIGSRFDLSKIEECHFGSDGDGWCKAGASVIPAKEKVTGHLDPFHVNRAVLSCFGKDEKKMAWQVLDVVFDGDVEAAACLLEACAGLGVAKSHAPKVAAYLRNNEDIIAVAGPSLGTMESENQHLYSARMEVWPCAWSVRGASDMARIRSRMHSGRAIPQQTREGSASARRKSRRSRREAAFYSRRGAGRMVESVGRGYLPRQASVAGMSAEVRHAAAVDAGMVALEG